MSQNDNIYTNMFSCQGFPEIPEKANLFDGRAVNFLYEYVVKNTSVVHDEVTGCLYPVRFQITLRSTLSNQFLATADFEYLFPPVSSNIEEGSKFENVMLTNCKDFLFDIVGEEFMRENVLRTDIDVMAVLFDKGVITVITQIIIDDSIVDKFTESLKSGLYMLPLILASGTSELFDKLFKEVKC